MQLEWRLGNRLEAIVIIQTSRNKPDLTNDSMLLDVKEIPPFFQREFICSMMINTKSNQSTEIMKEKQPKG